MSYLTITKHLDTHKRPQRRMEGGARRTVGSTALLAVLLGSSGGVAVDTVAATSASAASTISTLTAGGTLYSGDILQSPNKQIYATMQSDGNFVVYRTTGPTTRAVVWHTNTPGNPGAYIVNQGDGNIVIYAPLPNNQRKAIWWSGTSGRGAATLLVQDDENVVLYAPAGAGGRTATWSWKTGVIPAAPAPSSGVATLRQRIVAVALGEVGSGRSVEGNDENKKIVNCNYYSTIVSSGGPSCTTPSGLPGKQEAWCAQFVRYVYKTAGAGHYNNMDAGARSTKNYGTWKDNPKNDVTGIQPGDMIAFKLNTGTPNDDHVGIVVAVNGTSLTTVEGNSGDTVQRITTRKTTDATISGYATPLAG
jgi:hypothetical protein